MKAGRERQRGWIIDPYRYAVAAPSGVDCELLMHFDVSTGFLKDSSKRNRTVTNEPFGTGSITQGIGWRDGGADFVQQYPASTSSGNFNKHSKLRVGSQFDLGSLEFLISIVTDIVPPASGEVALLGNVEAAASGTRLGFYIVLTSTTIKFRYERGSAAALVLGPVVHSGTAISAAGYKRISIFRLRNGANDILHLYFDERRIAANGITGVPTLAPTSLDRLYIGACDVSTTVGSESVSSGLQGSVDEAYIVAPASMATTHYITAASDRWLAPWAPWAKTWSLSHPYSNKGWNYYDKGPNAWINNYGKSFSNDSNSLINGIRSVLSLNSGLVYWEVKTTSRFNTNSAQYVGIADATMALNDRPFFGAPGGRYSAFRLNGQYGSDAGFAGSGAVSVPGSGVQVVGLVANFSTRTLSVYVNNVFSSSRTWSAGASPMFAYACMETGAGRFCDLVLCLDSAEQTYSPPSGATPWLTSAPETFYYVP